MQKNSCDEFILSVFPPLGSADNRLSTADVHCQNETVFHPQQKRREEQRRMQDERNNCSQSRKEINGHWGKKTEDRRTGRRKKEEGRTLA